MPASCHRSFSCPDPRRTSAAAAARSDQLETLLEQFVELVDRASLQQHVPVGTGRLHLLRLGQVTFDQGAFHAVSAQPGAGDLGIVGKRNIELFAVFGAVTRNLAGSQVVVAVGLVTYGSKATAS